MGHSIQGGHQGSSLKTMLGPLAYGLSSTKATLSAPIDVHPLSESESPLEAVCVRADCARLDTVSPKSLADNLLAARLDSGGGYSV